MYKPVINVTDEYRWRPIPREQHPGTSHLLFKFHAVAMPGTAPTPLGLFQPRIPFSMKTQVFPAPSRRVAVRRADLLPACRSGLLAVLLALAAVPAALANGAGESAAWQFQTSADKVNQAAVQDMIQKRNMGYYTAPVYTTNIDRQINCNQSANATGNASDQGAAALSPSNSGATSDSTGNANTNTGGADGGQSSSDQGNSGSVGSSVNGNTTTAVSGSADQALNNNQNNSGTQTASVAGSTGCTFGVLN